MSISSQLLILNQTKQNIKSAINLKGVSVTDEAFAEYPDKVRLIPSGTGTYESQIILYLERRLKNLVVPNGTTVIADTAASQSSSLESVTIPNSVTSIGTGAFATNPRLTSVSIGTGVTTVGLKAFLGCDSLRSIVFPDSVTTINDMVFLDTHLEYLEIGTGIQSIGNQCVDSAHNNGIANIKATVPPTLGNHNFEYGWTIYVPDESVLAYQTATGWMSLSNKIMPVSQMPS